MRMNMPKLSKNKSDKFFWEIPGDVPGKSAEDDPFQSTRTAPDPHYQLVPQLTTRQSSHNSDFVASSSQQSNTHSNHTSGSDISVSKRINWMPLLLILLIVIGLGGVGYQYLTNSSELIKTADLNNRQTSTTSTLAIKKPKIFELILGEKNKTAQSKLRIITHVVVKGDTLWDIAETYVKDPFRYPELAELSKIKNPDLIYPYNLVRIHIYE